ADDVVGDGGDAGGPERVRPGAEDREGVPVAGVVRLEEAVADGRVAGAPHDEVALERPVPDGAVRPERRRVAEVRAERVERGGGREELLDRGRDEVLLLVPAVERLARLEVQDVDAPVRVVEGRVVEDGVEGGAEGLGGGLGAGRRREQEEEEQGEAHHGWSEVASRAWRSGEI